MIVHKSIPIDEIFLIVIIFMSLSFFLSFVGSKASFIFHNINPQINLALLIKFTLKKHLLFEWKLNRIHTHSFFSWILLNFHKIGSIRELIVNYVTQHMTPACNWLSYPVNSYRYIIFWEMGLTFYSRRSLFFPIFSDKKKDLRFFFWF